MIQYLTFSGLLFLTIAWGFILLMTSYCFWRVLKIQHRQKMIAIDKIKE